MHSTQLEIGSGRRVAQVPGKSGAPCIAWTYQTSHSFAVDIDSVWCAHEIAMSYRDTEGQRIALPLAARPVNGPMSISALYCTTDGVRAAGFARSARDYAKVGCLQTRQKIVIRHFSHA